MKILVTIPSGIVRDTFFTNKVKNQLEKLGEVVYNPLGRQYEKEELRDSLQDIDILITGWQTKKLDNETLAKANKLKLVAHTGGSVSVLATDDLYKTGAIVLSGNIVFAESVAEGCICYSMAALRRLEKNMKLVRDGLWKSVDYYNEGIMNRTIGLIGFGMIAKCFAKMLQPFNVDLKIYSSYLTADEASLYQAKVCSLEEILMTSDIISIHSGLSEKTFHMIGAKELEKIKDGALLLNTARGAIIDEQALIKELDKKRFMAALDVYENEPLDVNSPLRKMENVLLMPHQGGPTIDRREHVMLAILDDLREFIDGKCDFKCEITNSYARVMSGSIAK